MNSSDAQIENTQKQTPPCHNMGDSGAETQITPELMSDTSSLCMCDAGLNTPFNATLHKTPVTAIFYKVAFESIYDTSFPSLSLNERFRPPISFS